MELVQIKGEFIQSAFMMQSGQSDSGCQHIGEAVDMEAAQTMRLDTSGVPSEGWRGRGDPLIVSLHWQPEETEF